MAKTPLEKCKFLGFFNSLFFIVKLSFFVFQNITEHFLLIHFAFKKMECLNFSTKPWNNATFGPLLIHWCLWAKKAFFRSDASPVGFSCSICIKTKDGKGLNFSTKTMDYTLWRNATFTPFLNRFFYYYKMEKGLNLSTKTMVNLFGKMQILRLF